MLTFYARGDSSSANNSEINSQNQSQVPVTSLTFIKDPAAGASGDTILESNSGLSDPDTLMVIDGVERTFTVEFSGTLPQSKKFDDIAGLDLRGADVVVITDDLTGQRYYFTTDPAQNSAVIMSAFPNGAIPIGNVDNNPEVHICFVRGTLIETPSGPVPIEALSAGDIVATDIGPQAISWIGSSRYSLAETLAHPSLRPITFSAHALGPGVPHMDVTVSPNHSVVIEGARLELDIGTDRALCPAKFLVGRPGINFASPTRDIEYFHILLETHRILESSGLRSESLGHGPAARETLGPELWSELAARGHIPASSEVAKAPIRILKRHEIWAVAAT